MLYEKSKVRITITLTLRGTALLILSLEDSEDGQGVLEC